jgi:hypothetical protein
MNAAIDFVSEGWGSQSIASITTVSPRSPQHPVVSSLLDTVFQSGQRPAAPAFKAALRWANDLDALYAYPHRLTVASSGSIHFYFIRDRKIASFECDVDGDIILTLSDRSQDVEAEAYVVTDVAPQSALSKVLEFIRK